LGDGQHCKLPLAEIVKGIIWLCAEMPLVKPSEVSPSAHRTEFKTSALIQGSVHNAAGRIGARSSGKQTLSYHGTLLLACSCFWYHYRKPESME